MKLLLLIPVLLLSLQSQAIQCEVIFITQEVTTSETFPVSSSSQGHDVPEMTFTAQNHEVTAMADGKWLGLSWRKDTVLVAESISLIRDVTTQPRVLIMYNPANVDEQVSINCAD